MNVLVLNPPYLKRFSRPQRSPGVTRSGTLYFPMWLAYGAGSLLQAGHDVEFIDAVAADLDIEAVIARVRDRPPKMIVLDTSTPSIDNDLAMTARLKDAFPAATTVLVGTHVSALPDETLSRGEAVDCIARMEYDRTLVELADALEAGGDPAKVAGLTIRRNGAVADTPDRPFIEDLDALPFVSSVYKRYLDIRAYFNPNALWPMVTITSGRGCPHRCTFCVYPQTLMGRRFRTRSVENVVDEMATIAREFPHARAVFFEDDTLTASRRRTRLLCEEIRRRGLEICWTANARADLDYETLRAMREAGCRCLCVGFESGSQEVLDRMHKGARLEKMQRFAADARQAGVLVHGCFLVGCPGETRATMGETLKLALRLNPDTAQFYPLMVYPGTEGYRWARENGYLRARSYAEWNTPEGLHSAVVDLPGLSARDMCAFCDEARRRFYLRPGYIALKLMQSIRHPSEAVRIAKAAGAFWRHVLKY